MGNPMSDGAEEPLTRTEIVVVGAIVLILALWVVGGVVVAYLALRHGTVP